MKIGSCFGSKLFLEDVFESIELRLNGGSFFEDSFFSFENGQSGIGSTEISGDAKDIGFLCTFSGDDFFLMSKTDGGDVQDKAGVRWGDIASYPIYAVIVAGVQNSGYQFVEGFEGKFA